MKRIIASIMLVSFLFAITGCGMSRTQKGAVIGTTSGAAVGAAIGNKAGNTALGAILGAAIGGAAGTYIGHYMDKQAEEIEKDIEGARVERVGEGIKITFDSGILFDIDKASLRPAAVQNLDELATILNKYEKTNVLIEGHTDAMGPEEYNLELSRKRAQSVANQLAANNVDPTRFTIMGYGESQPIATNETVEGRQANRRVDIAIMADDKLKSAARERVSE
ncbi:MAG: OmpA family protein [Candidatus Krumholzibacteriales bacterium]